MLHVRHRTGLHRPHHVQRDLVAGAIAGQVAGLVAAAVMLFTAFVSCWVGSGRLADGSCPLPLAGALVLGRQGLPEEASSGSFHLGAWVAGLVLQQLGPALLWGLVFAIVVHTLDVRRLESLVLTGLGVGLLSQAIDVGLLVPLAFERTLGYDAWAAHVPSVVSLSGHVAYGATLGVFGFVRPHFRGPEW